MFTVGPDQAGTRAGADQVCTGTSSAPKQRLLVEARSAGGAMISPTLPTELYFLSGPISGSGGLTAGFLQHFFHQVSESDLSGQRSD